MSFFFLLLVFYFFYFGREMFPCSALLMGGSVGVRRSGLHEYEGVYDPVLMQ